MGPPTSIEFSEAFPNHYSQLLERGVRVEYPLLSLKASFPAHLDMSAAYVESLSVRSSAINLPCDLALGQDLSRFLEVLGPPHPQEDGAAYTYDWTKYECPDNSVYVWLGAISLARSSTNKVTEVRWEFFSD